MNISSFLQPKMYVTFLNEEDSAITGLRKMRKSGFTAIPVLTADSEYVGSISEGDFLRTVYDIAEQEEYEEDRRHIGVIDALKEKKISEIPRSKKYPAVRITASMDSLIDAAMRQNYVPVVDDRDVFIGIITRKAIIGYLADRQQDPVTMWNAAESARLPQAMQM